MIIKNITSEVQKISVAELVGEGRSYDIHIEPNGTTELIGLLIVDSSLPAGIIIVGTEQVEPSAETPAIVEEEPEVVAPVEPLAEPEVVEPEVVEPEVAESEVGETIPQVESNKFICDKCGAEFGSARGLNTHKNKSHND